MRKRCAVIILFVFIITWFMLLLVDAQEAPGLEDVLGNSSEDTFEDIQQLRRGYLAEEWKKILLENKYITWLDQSFTKINPVFVFLFSRDYSFSLVMFFVFLLWLFTLLSLFSYFMIIDNEWFRLGGALAGTVALAWAQIFNFVAGAVSKFILLGLNPWLRFFMWLIIFVLLVTYWYFNQMIAARIKKSKEKLKQEKLEQTVEENKRFREGVARGVS